ncbi:hypothetical protein [Niabella ginsengisoli]|uniref:Uncharacterized protein n=1 Tax=Niabella ginsengisoli TaxID=522298 RepID=A0ABS9SEJ7_9BACT|nr:hypothetical protein [Niabella ginsengisoli]MCH5596782.1 hypothetical protein [Niabella ginsengisoli]
MGSGCQKSPACAIYATTKWLDCSSPGWKALVWGNYKAIMPVTVKQKFGIPYLVQPAFTQRLGIFSSTEVSDEIRSCFISALKQKYPFAEICVNDVFKMFPGVLERKNYILNLNRPYSEITNEYKESLKQVLKQVTLKGNLILRKSQHTEQAVGFFKELNGSKINLTAFDYVKIKNAAKVFSPENAFVYEVYNIDQILLSTALYFKFENRLYKITAATSVGGALKKRIIL